MLWQSCLNYPTYTDMNVKFAPFVNIPISNNFPIAFSLCRNQVFYAHWGGYKPILPRPASTSIDAVFAGDAQYPASAAVRIPQYQWSEGRGGGSPGRGHLGLKYPRAVRLLEIQTRVGDTGSLHGETLPQLNVDINMGNGKHCATKWGYEKFCG